MNECPKDADHPYRLVENTCEYHLNGEGGAKLCTRKLNHFGDCHVHHISGECLEVYKRSRRVRKE